MVLKADGSGWTGDEEGELGSKATVGSLTGRPTDTVDRLHRGEHLGDMGVQVGMGEGAMVT